MVCASTNGLELIPQYLHPESIIVGVATFNPLDTDVRHMTRSNTGGYRARQTEDCGRVTVGSGGGGGGGGGGGNGGTGDGVPREALLAVGGVAALIAFRRFSG
jgi:hypothetical protein